MLRKCVARVFALGPTATTVELGVIVVLVGTAVLSMAFAMSESLAGVYQSLSAGLPGSGH